MFGGFSFWCFSNDQVDYTSWLFRDLEVFSMRMQILFRNCNNAKLSRPAKASGKLDNRPKEKPRPPCGVYK